jgi:uncharacterized protein
MKGKFLTAEWRKLLMANFEIEPSLLKSYLPAHTEIDFFMGKTYISLVGFMFLNTKVLGYKIPFHVNFEEVNLRFYVKHQKGEEVRRGVVFIREIVPKPAIAWVANLAYRENYIALPMNHSIENVEQALRVGYQWQYKGGKYALEAHAEPKSQALLPHSEAEFITEHYWGYSRWNPQKTIEYQVEHPRWDIYSVQTFESKGDWRKLYGDTFAEILNQKPASVLLAEGSQISVRKPSVIA